MCGRPMVFPWVPVVSPRVLLLDMRGSCRCDSETAASRDLCREGYPSGVAGVVKAEVEGGTERRRQSRYSVDAQVKRANHRAASPLPSAGCAISQARRPIVNP